VDGITAYYYYYYYYYRYLYSVSSQVAVQLRNGAANVLKQLRDVQQISFQFFFTCPLLAIHAKQWQWQ